ncbi:MAG: hypothetical protein ACYS5V_11180 [Planctomycetota bacterium]|jgi:hypothetical protein
MTLDELVQTVPEQWQPIVSRYGPILLEMSTEDLWAWIQLLAEGHDRRAYRAVLARMDDELLNEWDRVAERWQGANEENARRRRIQTEALQAVLHVLLAAALSMVGL